MNPRPRILIVYTGGTIGMFQDEETGSLRPFDLDRLLKFAPELSQVACDLDMSTFDPPLDSSNMQPSHWRRIGEVISENYHAYHGFVVLHGTDTMSFSASALSFSLSNLGKPVVFTGSQLPIGLTRTDARENLVTAVEIAAYAERGRAMVPEVCLYFEDELYRGNRTHKASSEQFEAFRSENYPSLASAGIRIKFKEAYIQTHPEEPFEFLPEIDPRVGVVKVFPGIQEEWLEQVLGGNSLRAVILETYGAGNAPTEKWFLNLLEKAQNTGKILVNKSQCTGGGVDMGRYETSRRLKEMGIWSAGDMSFESSLTKLMFVLGNPERFPNLQDAYERSLRGELSQG